MSRIGFSQHQMSQHGPMLMVSAMHVSECKVTIDLEEHRLAKHGAMRLAACARRQVIAAVGCRDPADAVSVAPKASTARFLRLAIHVETELRNTAAAGADRVSSCSNLAGQAARDPLPGLPGVPSFCIGRNECGRTWIEGTT